MLTGKNLDRELADWLSKQSTLSPNERQAVHSICFDTLRHYGLINAQLDTLLSAPLTDAPVRNLLLVSLAQLQFSRAAVHTVVDHAVNAAVAMGFARAKGLTNAVLRNYLRAPEKFARNRFKDAVAQYDYPRWWIARIEEEHPEQWREVLLSTLQRPPLTLRVNVQKTSVENYLMALAKDGISARAMPEVSEVAIQLETPVPVTNLPQFSEGAVSVQDAGAQMAARLLDARDGMKVLDACAAPGGKTGHILERANVHMTAIDTDKLRLKRVSDNLRRLQRHATLVAADAANLDMWWKDAGKPAFDRILLDVPCSGSGVTRRHPDIKWIRRETDMKRFAESQLRLLRGVWPALARGGVLLYATCSLFKAENQEVVATFLAGTADARAKTLPKGVAATNDATDLMLLPNDLHDGFYYALLQKA